MSALLSLRVAAAGLLTSVQDRGRHGYQHLGVAVGGVMDEVSHRLANLLVGNGQGAATLEITLTGPRLLFEDQALIALCGGDLSPELDGTPVPLWRPVLVRAGASLAFGRIEQGARCYLAVAGGLGVPPVLGSASTNLTAQFGGYLGRPVLAGDSFPLQPLPRERYPGLQERFRREGPPGLALTWFPAWFREVDFLRPAPLRVIPGPQWPRLARSSRTAFMESVFRVASNSNRMGLRFQGPRLALDRPLEMISSGVAAGTVQLPPDGSPIVLMADRQTTGGYPRLGEVATVDLPRAAQLRPGEEVRFVRVSLKEAQELFLKREERFRQLEQALAQRRNH